jgi:hypothetical protein
MWKERVSHPQYYFVPYSQLISDTQFAARAKFIKNKAVVNEDSSGSLGALQVRLFASNT